MRLLTYTNYRGDSITFNGSPFAISQINGLGDVDADVQQQKSPYQDGTSYIDASLEPRFIDFEVFIQSKNDTDMSNKRSLLSMIFNPKLGVGRFEYKYGDIKREIYAIPEKVPSFPVGAENRGLRHQIALVNLICPNPYWQSKTYIETPIFEPLFEFPFEGEFEMGLQKEERLINNDSDAELPIQVVFYGPAQTPQIKNLTTDEFIKINRSLGEHEKLLIDTTDGIKSVIFEDENGIQEDVFHWIDLDSTFFKLALGENEISCMCVSSNLSKEFEIMYKKQYVGV